MNFFYIYNVCEKTAFYISRMPHWWSYSIVIVSTPGGEIPHCLHCSLWESTDWSRHGSSIYFHIWCVQLTSDFAQGFHFLCTALGVVLSPTPWRVSKSTCYYNYLSSWSPLTRGATWGVIHPQNHIILSCSM